MLGRRESLALVRAAVQENALQVEAINCLMDWALPDDPDPRPALETALRVATAAGAKVIVCTGPIRLGTLPPTDVVVASAGQRLAAMAAVVRSSGVQLALEQVGQSSTRPLAVSGIWRLDDALSVVQCAGDDVLVTLDSHNLATANQHFDLIRKVPVSRIGIVQIAGISSTKRDRALPGEGSTDNAYFMHALAAMGYTGAVSIELFPSRPWENPNIFASLAYARVRDLIDAAITPTWE